MPRKKNPLRTLLLLPIAAVVFTVGWLMKCTPQRKHQPTKVKNKQEAKRQDVEFLVGLEEQQALVVDN